MFQVKLKVGCGKHRIKAGVFAKPGDIFEVTEKTFNKVKDKVERVLSAADLQKMAEEAAAKEKEAAQRAAKKAEALAEKAAKSEAAVKQSKPGSASSAKG